jgi:hypothetical protein
MRAATLLTSILVGVACGGGGDSAEAAGVTDPPAAASALVTLQGCLRVPAMARSRSVGNARRDVSSFGAKPNDDGDDSDAIQKALDTLEPGETRAPTWHHDHRRRRDAARDQSR